MAIRASLMRWALIALLPALSPMPASTAEINLWRLGADGNFADARWCRSDCTPTAAVCDLPISDAPGDSAALSCGGSVELTHGSHTLNDFMLSVSRGSGGGALTVNGGELNLSELTIARAVEETTPPVLRIESGAIHLTSPIGTLLTAEGSTVLQSGGELSHSAGWDGTVNIHGDYTASGGAIEVGIFSVAHPGRLTLNGPVTLSADTLLVNGELAVGDANAALTVKRFALEQTFGNQPPRFVAVDGSTIAVRDYFGTPSQLRGGGLGHTTAAFDDDTGYGVLLGNGGRLSMSAEDRGCEGFDGNQVLKRLVVGAPHPTLVISDGVAYVERIDVSAGSRLIAESGFTLYYRELNIAEGGGVDFGGGAELTAIHCGDGGLTVNSSADREEIAPGDGVCHTGRTLDDGRPECTLRAAIEEGSVGATHTITFDLPAGDRLIRPESPLPPISGALTLRGEKRITLRGDLAGSGTDGIVCDAECTLWGITIEGFDGDGVLGRASVNAHDVVIRDNRGWGIHGLDTVSVGDVDGLNVVQRSTLQGNGADGGGGGVYTVGGYTAVRATTIVENGGPGILAKQAVTVYDVTIRDNDGYGIASHREVRLANGPARSVISGNHGMGVSAGSDYAEECGDAGASCTGFLAESPLDIVDNHGWGVSAKGAVSIGDISGLNRPATSRVSGNGRGTRCVAWGVIDIDADPDADTEPCDGGGVLSWDDGAVLRLTTVSDNGGSGVLAADEVIAYGVTISANRGYGIDARDKVEILAGRQASQVVGNGGTGIAATGEFLAESPVVVTDNAGAGIRARHAVSLGVLSEGPTIEGTSQIARNGRGGDCEVMDPIQVSSSPTIETEPCTDGGVVSLNDGVTAHRVRIIDNGVTGIRAAGDVALDTAWVRENRGEGIHGDGNLTFDEGELCGHGEQNLVIAGTATLDAVTVEDLCISAASSVAITVNGEREEQRLWSAETVSIGVESFPGETAGDTDWWLLAESPAGTFHLDTADGQWRTGEGVGYQGPAFESGASELLNLPGGTLAPGVYTLTFGFDDRPNGRIDPDASRNASITLEVE